MVALSPGESWLLTSLFIFGVPLVGFLLVRGWLKLDAWVRAYLAEFLERERKSLEMQMVQQKVFARLEACEFRKTYLADGTPVYIRVNLITPARPKERAQ